MPRDFKKKEGKNKQEKIEILERKKKKFQSVHGSRLEKKNPVPCHPPPPPRFLVIYSWHLT